MLMATTKREAKRELELIDDEIRDLVAWAQAGDERYDGEHFCEMLEQRRQLTREWELD